jgi:heterotetrameric sarcosine oxidase gamma subunit
VNRNDTTCRIESRPAARVLEFCAYRWPAPQDLGADWPSAPGAIRYDAIQQPELLHFAPGRWLAPDPKPELAALLQAAASAGTGTLVDVTGKWDRVIVSGAQATRVLASTISVDVVLNDRGCAAATLFDCPAIVLRQGTAFTLWVQSSYGADFLAAAERQQAALA